MTTILEKIADDSGKTREHIASVMGYTRQAIHKKLKKPRQMTIDDIELFAKVVGRSPRTLFSLIINN